MSFMKREEQMTFANTGFQDAPLGMLRKRADLRTCHPERRFAKRTAVEGPPQSRHSAAVPRLRAFGAALGMTTKSFRAAPNDKKRAFFYCNKPHEARRADDVCQHRISGCSARNAPK